MTVSAPCIGKEKDWRPGVEKVTLSADFKCSLGQNCDGIEWLCIFRVVGAELLTDERPVP
jgi:hypothetical protein